MPVLLALVLCACGPVAVSPGASAAASGKSGELSILAAASLGRVLEEAKAAYEATEPALRLVVSTGSSAALATQIEQGAPADVFLSADMANAERLVEGGLADGGPVVFAANALTVIAPAGNPAAIGSPADLARPGLRIVAAGEHVPVTTYATQLVANLAGLAGYPADFVAAYAANVVSREDDARAVVAKVGLGEGDAAIVYRTDAVASDALETIDVPAEANVVASYAGVVVAGSAEREAARAFLDWFAGAEGRAILARSGFLPPVR